MKIPIEMVRFLMGESQCDWTRGYLKAILDLEELGPAALEAQALLILQSVDPNTKNGLLSAVKDLRSKFNLTLVDSKAMVDEYCETGRVIFPKGK